MPTTMTFTYKLAQYSSMINSISFGTGALMFFFFFNDPATTEFYPLPLHDALPIWLLPLGNASAIYETARRLRADMTALVGRLLPSRMEKAIGEAVSAHAEQLNAELFNPAVIRLEIGRAHV